MNLDEERKSFEELPLAKLASSQDWVRYHKESNTYYPNEDFCPESAPETINFAWQSWQAAKAHEAKKLEGCVVVPVESIEAALLWMDEDIDAHHMSNEGFDKLFEHKPILEKILLEAARGGNE